MDQSTGDPWLDAQIIADGGSVPVKDWWLHRFEAGPGKLQGESFPRITAYLYMVDADEIISTSEDPMGYIGLVRKLPWEDDPDTAWVIRESEVGFLTAYKVEPDELDEMRDSVPDEDDDRGDDPLDRDPPDDSPSIEDSVPFEVLALHAEIRESQDPPFVGAGDYHDFLLTCSVETLAEHLVEIYQALWPTHDHSWSPDTIQSVAETFTSRGYGA